MGAKNIALPAARSRHLHMVTDCHPSQPTGARTHATGPRSHLLGLPVSSRCIPIHLPRRPPHQEHTQGYSPPEYPGARHSSCHTHLASGYSLIRCIHSTQYEIVLANPRRPLRMSGAHHVSADGRCLEVYKCVPQNAREPLRPEIDDNCTWLWTGDHSWHHQPASLPQVIMNHITGSRARSQLGATVHPWTWCMMRGRITGTCCSVTSTLPWLAHGSQHQLW